MNTLKRKKNCIPADEVDDVVLAMYLNIIEYIDEEKQDELMEMIGLSEKIEGVISEIENNAREDGEKKGERKIIKKLLKTFTEDEVSKILDIEKTTLLTLIHK